MLHYPTAWVRLNLRLEDLGQPDPDKLIPLEYVPVALTVHRNRWNEADKIEVVVDFEDFPLDPRILRGVTIEAYLADAKGLDPDFWLKQDRKNLVADNAVFVGVVDEVETSIDDGWRKTRLRGRDYTAYFLDVQMQPGPISYMKDGRKLTLVEVIQDIVAQHPNAGAIKVVPDDDVPDIYPADYKLRGDKPKSGGRRKREGERIWDALTEIALEAGFILYVELDRIRIRRPRTIFFATGAEPSAGYRWTFGENLKRLSTFRNMGRQHGINVRVTSYSPDDKRSLVAIAPKDALEASKAEISAAPVATEGARKTSTATRVTFVPFVVRGITDPAQLQEIADQLYELLRHHELEGELETDDLVDSLDHNVLRIAYGDPVYIDIAESFRSILTLDRGAQVERLLEVGYDRKTAQKITQALENIRVPFYVHSAKHRFGLDEDEGYSLTVEVRSRREVEVEV